MSFSLNSQLEGFTAKPAGCTGQPLQLCPDSAAGLGGDELPVDTRLWIGLMIAVSTPCTLAAASVWTRKAGGNDAVSLLTTLVTNTMCFVVTPFWLVTATGQSVELDMQDLAKRLVYRIVLLPTMIGQSLRLSRSLADFATRRKTPIGVVAQSCVLILVLLASLGGGIKLRDANLGQQIGSTSGFIWSTCIAIHLAAFFVAWRGGGLLGFERKDRIAASFAGSQRTLPIGVYTSHDHISVRRCRVIDSLPIRSPFSPC